MTQSHITMKGIHGCLKSDSLTVHSSVPVLCCGNKERGLHVLFRLWTWWLQKQLGSTVHLENQTNLSVTFTSHRDFTTVNLIIWHIYQLSDTFILIKLEWEHLNKCPLCSISLDLNCILGVMIEQRNIVSTSIIGKRLIHFRQVS